jgi:sarcosine oxidase subunit gamma
MADTETVPSLSVRRAPPEVLLQVAAYRGGEAGVALAEALACALPAQNRWIGGPHGLLASTGNGRWLVVGQGEAEPALLERVEAAVADRAAVVDLTHAREVFSLTGEGARTVLFKGCTADLRPSSFGPAGAIATAIGKIGATILAHDGERFDVQVPSSYADFFGEWLAVASREFV